MAPAANTIYVADAEAVAQITTRRNDFPKPTWNYGFVDIYGKNVVSTEGAVWRHHRKITSPPFTEKNNRLVWLESLHQAQSMLTGWVGKESRPTGPLKDIAAQSMRLSLHVISRAGFGVRLLWPHEEAKQQLPPGHTWTYKDALSTLLDNVLILMLTPRFIVKYSPLQMHKTAYQALTEWTKYMHEIYDEKCAEVAKGDSREVSSFFFLPKDCILMASRREFPLTFGKGMDLMGALVRGAGVASSPDAAKSNGNIRSGKTDPQKQIFSMDEILGNAFVFILAGHETAANTIHFSILYLAMHWSSQKRVQDDLDAILGNRPIPEWSYEDDMPKLFGSMLGAVMAEELRLIPPVVGIPKVVTPHTPQGLNVGGKHYIAPERAYITIHAVGLHRNPKHWPHTSEQDLHEFRPERWLLDPSKASTNTDDDTYETEEGLEADGPDKRPDTAASLFRPAKGAYVPFSEGYRSCLGRRFAQVEILAVLAVVFKNWSVELDVGEWLSDKELETATEQQKRDAWNKADAKARYLLKYGMMAIITMQMRKDKVPMRFVKRGTEKFKFG